MRTFFNFDGPFFTHLSRLADILWLNILFIICCIPIFTIGAATTSLYYVTLKMVRDEESYITKSFFKSFKQNFLQATGIWLIILVVGIVIAMDYRMVVFEEYAYLIPSAAVRNVIMVASMVMIIVLANVTVYVFPILAKFDNTIKNTIRNAFLMSIRHLPYTVLLIIIPIVPIVLMYFSVHMYLLVVIMFSAEAYISSKLFVKIFDNYINPVVDEESKEGVNEEA